MPEREERSLIETLFTGIAKRILGGLNRYVEQVLKRLLRLAGLYLAGAVLALFGVAFVSVGVVKWLVMIVPSWLAWLMVGVVLFLLGVVLTLSAFLASRA